MTNLRWRIAGVIYLGMALNYLDRQVLSILAPEIRDSFQLTNSDYAHIVFAFQLAYLLSSGAGGRLADWLGVRLGYAAMMVFWSVASALHAAAAGVGSLMAFRFLLGLGEGGAFPACAKAMSEWFPRKERALAMGFINGSLSLGGILAPPLTAVLALRFGWRAAFLVIASLGFLWLAVWLPSYRSPRQHPRLGAEEWAHIDDGERESADEPAGAPPGDVLRFPQMWALLAARLIADPPWQFYLFWLPEYLRRERGMQLAEIGMLAWLPFLAGAIGGAAGGWASGRLIRSGMDAVRARKIAMSAAATLMPAGIAAALAPNGWWAVAWVSVAAAGHNAWVSNAQTLPADVLPARVVGTAVGISQMAGYCGNLAATLVTGYVLDRFSYLPVFVVAGLLHPLATVVLLAGFVRVGRVADHFRAQPR
jgi:ACS family hexuronate transporter-like MFS transporter